MSTGGGGVDATPPFFGPGTTPVMDPSALARLSSMGGSANEMGGTSSSIGTAGDPANQFSVFMGNLNNKDPQAVMKMVKSFQSLAAKPNGNDALAKLAIPMLMQQFKNDGSVQQQMSSMFSNPVGMQAAQKMKGLLG